MKISTPQIDSTDINSIHKVLKSIGYQHLVML